MKWKMILLAVIPVVAAWGCGKDAKPRPSPAPPASSPAPTSTAGVPEPAPVGSKLLDAGGDFTLFVSNQSFAISPVDIRVEIDGEAVVQRDFDVGNQHCWVTFKLRLSPGKHKVRVASQKGTAELLQEFNVAGKHWAVIDYWYYPPGAKGASPTPRHFSFDIYDHPVLFQ